MKYFQALNYYTVLDRTITAETTTSDFTAKIIQTGDTLVLAGNAEDHKVFVFEKSPDDWKANEIDLNPTAFDTNLGCDVRYYAINNAIRCCNSTTQKSWEYKVVWICK